MDELFFICPLYGPRNRSRQKQTYSGLSSDYAVSDCRFINLPIFSNFIGPVLNRTGLGLVIDGTDDFFSANKIAMDELLTFVRLLLAPRHRSGEEKAYKNFSSDFYSPT